MVINKIVKNYESVPIQFRASLWFLICSFIQKAVSVITTPIFTRIMSPTEYGRYGVFNSWYGIISIIVALALTGGVHIQGMVKFDEEKGVFSSSLQGLTATLVLGWFIIYISFRTFWNRVFSLSTVQITAMFVIIWMTAIFGLWANEQRIMYAYKALVSITLVSTILRSIIEILLVMYCEDKATAMIVGWAVADFLMFSWMFVVQIKRGKEICNRKFWIYALAFNIPLVPHYLSQVILNNTDRIMIQRLIGNEEAGVYNLAYSLSLIMILFNSAFTQTLNPWMYQKIKDKKAKDIAPIAYATLIIIGGVNIILIMLAPEALAFFAPSPYHGAIWVIPPVSMSVFFMFSYDLYAKHAFYYEKTRAIMLASVSGAALNILLNYIFISRFGYIAAGYTTLFCYIVYACAHYIFMRRVCRQCCEGVYPYTTKKIIAISCSFLIVGFLCMLTYDYPVIRYGIITTAAILLFLNRHYIIDYLRKIVYLRKGAPT